MRTPRTRSLWTFPAKTPARRQERRRRLLRLEELEPRRLLAPADLAAIAGRAFRDINGDGYTPGEEIAGATVTLQWDLNANGVLDAGDGSALALAVTDAAGCYRFERLAAGDYFVQLPAQVAGSITVRQQTSPLIVVTSADAEGITGLSIDGFTTAQSVIASVPVGVPASSSTPAAEALGGERDMSAQLSAGEPVDYIQLQAFAGQLMLNGSLGATGIASVVWDGLDGNGHVLDPTGLRVAGQGVDLTAGGILTCLRLTLGVDKPNGAAAVRVYTDANNWSQTVVPLAETGGPPNWEYVIGFSDFTTAAGAGADFGNVGALVLEITANTAAMDGQLTVFESRGATVLTQDFDNALSADLSLVLTVDKIAPLVGSNVTYTVNVNNVGPDAATNVVVSALLPAGLTFVSATASAGSYNSASGFWTVGALPLGSSATLQLIATVTGADTIVNTVEVAAVAQPDPDSTPNNGNPAEDDQSSTTLTPETPAAPDLVAFAQALTAAGVKFYAAAWCGHCSDQKALFEDGADYLPFIEVTNPDRTLNQVGIDENIIAFPTWEFPDASRLTGIQTLDTISQRSGVGIPLSSNPFVKPIEDLTLLGGSPLMVPLDGYDPNGGLLTYTVTSDNPALVTASLQQGNPSMQIATDSWGSMAFQLFQDKAPRPVERVSQLAQDGFYEGIIFHRVIEGFVIQGGDPTGTGTGGSTLGYFDDQFHVDLQHNRAGLISYAKSTDDTNDSQFFVTLGPTRWLDFNHSIFGVLVEGYPVLEAIGSTATNVSDRPIYDILMESVDIFADQENGVVMLKAAEGASGQANITVTVADPQGHTLQRTFQVTVLPDTTPNGGANGGPFLQDIAPVSTPLDTPVDIQLAAIDVEGNPVYYDATPISGAPYTVSVAHDTGLVTVTPNSGFSGQTTVRVAVRAVSGSDTYDPWDTQSVPLTVLPSGPTQQVRLRLEAADLAGNAITTIASGGEFLLKLYAQDLRPDAEGVFAAYLDVNYDPALVSAVDSSLTFSEPYVNGKSGDLSTPGLIDEGGAFDGFSQAGDAEMLVFSVRMRADQAGEGQFAGDPADGVGHEILVYGGTSLVPWDAVQFVPAEISILPELDFGDAPVPYATTLAEDGPCHSATGPRLGLQRDKEGDGVHSAGADGDDLAGTPDDEDGVTLVRPLVVGQQDATFTINVQQAPAGAKLDAWLDFNADGSWDGPDERIADGLSVADGDNQLTFAIPATAAEGATYARFRLSTAGGLLPTGWTADGEVEDYQVTITRHLQVVLPGGNGSDDITVRRRGADVEVYDNVGKTVLASGPLACVLSVSIQGADVENDRVTVDYAYGGFFELQDGVSFDGGAGGHDELAVQGSGTTVARYVSRGGELGDATIATAEGVQHNDVRFTRVEPLTLRGLLVCSVEGALHVGGQTLTLEVATMTALDWLTTLAGGSVVAGGGVTLGSGDNLLGSGVVQARVAAAVGSSLRATGALELGDSASLAGFYSDGELHTGLGPVTIHDANEAVLGTLTVLGDADHDGTLAAPHGLLLEAGKAFQGRGVVSTIGGQFKNNGYVVGVEPNLTFQQLVTGIGDFAGPIVFNGGYSPGLSPAQIDFFDGVTFSTTNTLTIELGGRTPGDGFDRLDVAGQAQLGGTLDVDLIDGFVPVVGDSFEIISAAGGVAGTFATETLPALPAGRRWQVQYHTGDVTLAVVPATLIVTQLTPTPSGFVAQFSGELKLAGLNLYDGAGGALGPADVLLKDSANRVVAGSMVVAGDRQAIEFVKTGGTLLPGGYTVTLRSGAGAFRDVNDGPLDGNKDGTSGDDFTAPLTVAESSDRVVSLPDMARGAGQSVNIPHTAAGLPIRLDNATGVTSLAVDLVYEQTLLQITAATLAAGVPADWSVTLDTSTAGAAKVTASGTTPLAGANVDVVRLTAAVPNTVAYGASQAIRLEHVACNAGALSAVGDVAVHKAVYLGDTDGSGVHSSADAFLIVQAALGSASGFAAHSWTDPRIVGDGDGSGALSAADAFLVVQEGLNLSEPFLPDNPHIGLTPVGGGVDPQFRIDVNIPASADGVVTVPVNLAIEAEATNVGAFDFELFFDPSQLAIQLPEGVVAGADTAGWAVTGTLVACGHLRVGMVSSRGQPLAPGLREIAWLQFHVAASVPDAVPVAERAGYDSAVPVSERPGYVVGLDIEPVDRRAGGYTWTAVDGSLAVVHGRARAAVDERTMAEAWRDRIFGDEQTELLPLEILLRDLADDVGTVCR